MKPVIIDRTQPNEFITKFTKYKSAGTLLDLGAGHGRHAIFAAERGFVVEAVEPDKTLCDDIAAKAQEKGLKIEIVRSDIESYKPSKEFDVIICAMVFHFLSLDAIKYTLNLMLEATKPGGVNVISAYTNLNPDESMAGNPYGNTNYLLKPGELAPYYSDWEILEYLEDWTEPGIVKAGDAPKSYHKVNLIAQKPA